MEGTSSISSTGEVSFLVTGTEHTFTCQVGIILVVLANRLICGSKGAVFKVVSIIAAHEIDSTVLISDVTIVWLCNDVGRTCEINTPAKQQ